ncbi:MAG: 16S rRNA (uracil(1498)-N(3))-methyltransferase [Burkholderiaceae bacterium]
MSAPRLYVEHALSPGMELGLGDNAMRHVQVLRLQPGAALTLFDGRGGQWQAQVTRIGRRAVSVRVGAHEDVERELSRAVTVAVGMPANERMDALIEKATELGVAAIQPLVCERSVLRVAGERAERKAAHWLAVAAAACEQCGRNRVPAVAPAVPLANWLASPGLAPQRWLLSLGPEAAAPQRPPAASAVCVLSGPEGGFTAAEEAAAQLAGFRPVSLGVRVLRADTAPLAALAWLALGDA